MHIHYRVSIKGRIFTKVFSTDAKKIPKFLYHAYPMSAAAVWERLIFFPLLILLLLVVPFDHGAEFLASRNFHYLEVAACSGQINIDTEGE